MTSDRVSVVRTETVNTPVARRNRVPHWPAWILSAITTCLLLYALAVIGSEYTPVPDESLRERVGGMVLLTWYVLPLLSLLVGQVLLARGQAARFAVFLTSLIVSGVIVLLHNGPPSSGHFGTPRTNLVAAILFLAITSPPVAITLLGLWVAMLLSRSKEHPDDKHMQRHG